VVSATQRHAVGHYRDVVAVSGPRTRMSVSSEVSPTHHTQLPKSMHLIHFRCIRQRLQLSLLTTVGSIMPWRRLGFSSGRLVAHILPLTPVNTFPHSAELDDARKPQAHARPRACIDHAWVGRSLPISAPQRQRERCPGSFPDICDYRVVTTRALHLSTFGRAG
jgi:hypothetical protein